MKDLYLDFRHQNRIDQIGLVLLFLFPVGATYIRHWLSYIFVLLFFFSVYYLITEKHTIKNWRKEEKVLIGIFVAYFTVFMISALLNGWGKEQTYAAGLEIRFLVIVPIYFMIKTLPSGLRYLLFGCVFGVIGSFAQSVYEIVMPDPRYLEKGIVQGVYGHLFIGPITILLTSVACAYLIQISSKKYYKCVLVFLISVFVAVTTAARSSWVAVVIVLPVIIYLSSIKYILHVLAIFLAGIILIVSVNTNIQHRISSVFKEAMHFADIHKDHKTWSGGESIVLRLKLWSATLLFFKKNPLFGIGQGNFQKRIHIYRDKGLVYQETVWAPHMHNAFLEMLVNRGVFGLSVALMLYFYPLYIFIKGLKVNREAAIAGILFVTCMTIFSLTDSSPLIKNNYVAIFLIFLATIFSTVIKSKQASEKVLNA